MRNVCEKLFRVAYHPSKEKKKFSNEVIGKNKNDNKIIKKNCLIMKLDESSFSLLLANSCNVKGSKRKSSENIIANNL